MIFHLEEDNINFPDPSLAEEDGLLAIGGDLSPVRLVAAYQQGIFPWFSEEDPICWFSPHERCVIFPDKIYISSSMKKFISSDRYTVTMNKDFRSVIENCSSVFRPGQDCTWITEDMKKAYTALYDLGIAHSIEVWNNKNELTGGMYGIKIGEIFCGESMFSKESNTSKAALIWLCKNTGIRLLDCQVPNPHLMSLGAEMISQKTFLEILKDRKSE